MSLPAWFRLKQRIEAERADATLKEREACARAVEEHACQHGTTCVGSFDIAAAIRARPPVLRI